MRLVQDSAGMERKKLIREETNELCSLFQKLETVSDIIDKERFKSMRALQGSMFVEDKISNNDLRKVVEEWGMY